jgi:hypothetical protein
MLTEPIAEPRSNRYGRMAEDHMRRYLPDRYEAIEDPTSHFTALGEQVAQEVEEATRALIEAEERLDPTSPTDYEARRGRANMALLRAEETVLAELVWLTPEADPDDAPRDETGAFTGADPAMGPWIPLLPSSEDPED